MSDVNLEQIARAIDLVLRAHLPQSLAEVAQQMESQDADYYGAIGEPVPNTPLDDPSYYFVGHDPLIMERPLELFPIVATMVHHHAPAGGGDNYARIANESFIEVFVYTEDPDTSYRVASRYARAVHKLILSSGNFGLEQVEIIDVEPDVDVSNSFTRRKGNVDNTTLYVQGARIDFTVSQNQVVTEQDIDQW